ncbi:hypothetical protein CSAL01_12159 [Colletotrichum salicis]|uniref:Fungal N-terminal domain-containing protein n=1 Tax=Colletotrichum salicis TaxID=1209931 RepID=A0A135UYT0_9PEZI|nr:hypothetical protein CSAL01_12159 [Colletotrichum salicis]
MAETIGVVASLAAFVSLSEKVMKTASDFGINTKDSEFFETLERVLCSVGIMLKLFMDSGTGSLTGNVHGKMNTSRIRSQISKAVWEIERVIDEIEDRPVIARRPFRGSNNVSRLIRVANKIESTLQLRCSLEHTLTLRQIQDRLNTVFELSGQTAAGSKAACDTIQSIEKRIKVGAKEEEEIAKATERWDGMNPDSSSQERATNIETIRDVLQITFGSLRGFKNDPMSLPFVIPVPAAEDVQARVKLDTGSRWNWISSEVLRKAGISYETGEDLDLGEYNGAGKDPLTFKPLGRVSVTWFSTNQTLSKTDDFLVHDPSYIPCDVILGETWIFDDLTRHQISEPVLQIRQLITKGLSLTLNPAEKIC